MKPIVGPPEGQGMATRGRSPTKGRERWPRSARLLKRGEFQKVYTTGRRVSTPLFAAFLLRTESPTSRVGLTVSRALGGAVKRNRIRRRMREAVRKHYMEIGPGWNIVFNPRRTVLEAESQALEREVGRLFGTLRASKS